MQRLGTIFRIFVLAAVVLLSPVAAKTKLTSSWSADEIGADRSARFLVLARIAEESARRTLEDAVVKKLEDSGIGAHPAYQILAEDELQDEAAIRTKAEALGIGAGILFTVTGESTKVQSGSNVHASVGVPMRAGPFSVFVGSSVPLGGGPQQVRTVEVKAELHAKEGTNPRWIATFATDLEGGAERAASEIASKTIKQLKKAGLFD